jgi:EVE domain
MSVSLNEILDLVGPLDDSAGEDTPRERFRRFLRKNVHEVGEIRDHIEQCLRTSGDQYNRALQDLVNYVGEFLGFKVEFGRYRGVPNQIGFDGLWQSPTGMNLVVEVKTTETYAIKTAILVGYVDDLISEKRVPSWDAALGLYVVGRPDPELRQLENAIVAEKRTHQLRIVSVESLLSLAEIMSEYDVTHEDMLVMLRPSGPGIDALADLIARLVAQRTAEQTELVAAPVAASAPPIPISVSGTPATQEYWITPVKDHEKETAIDCVKNLVGKHGIYAFGERTPGRTHIKKGDWLCFYASGDGIVAHAKVASAPEKKPDERVIHPQDYPYTLRVQDQRLYAGDPFVLDAKVRQQLDAFRGRDPDKSWSWFVQATRKITEHDFRLLTRG